MKNLKRTARRLLLAVALLTVIAVVGVVTVFYTLLNLSVPQTEGTVQLDEVTGQVEIIYDRMGLPRIRAESRQDGFFALGWVHASDRLFQMEMLRRLAAGRIAEVVGAGALEQDRQQRRIGHARRAKRALATLDDANRELLQAYADGVNAYSRECRALPIEFYLLPIKSEPWTAADCLTLLSFQTWFSNALLNRDEFFLHLSQTIDSSQVASLDRPYPNWAPVTVNDDASYGRTGVTRGSERATAETADVPARLRTEWIDRQALAAIPSLSSNAWVIAPARSASGHAMLASDPHLQINRLPQFWHYVGMHIAQTNTSIVGITTPGLPFVIMGHNGKVAYAFTAGGVDLIDYYLEKINPEDTDQYLTESGWQFFDIITDTLYVAGLDTAVVMTTRWSRHGPVVPRDDSLGGVYTLRWAGFDTDLNQALTSGLALHNVSTFDDFRQTVTGLGALDANWLYADREGNIGYQLGTPVPVRRHRGNFPLPGWTEDYEWDGYYPLEQTPHSYNPARGWLGSCNNLSQRDGLAYDIPGNYLPERILRLEQLMTGAAELTSDDMGAMQSDRIDSYLMRWRVELAELCREAGDTARAASMRQWDGSTSATSKETLLLELFLANLTRMTFEDELGDAYSRVRKVQMDQIYHSADSFWFDDTTTADHVESRREIALRALEVSFEQAADNTWGERHSLTMEHPMAAVPVLGSILDLRFGPWPWSGTGSTLNAAFNIKSDDNRFRTVVGPSWRFVIDFNDIDAATIVLPSGNSGNPASDHFFDFNEMWQNGERWTVPLSYDKAKQRAVSTLILMPATGAK